MEYQTRFLPYGDVLSQGACCKAITAFHRLVKFGMLECPMWHIFSLAAVLYVRCVIVYSLSGVGENEL